MITVPITDNIFNEATKLALELGVLKRSITNGKGSLAGFIDEIVVHNLYGGQRVNTYDYDLILPNNIKVDVKTKRTTVKPQPHYECSIYKQGTFQKCDRYIFCRVNIKEKLCYILGWIDKKDYFKKAIFMKKGQLDPSNNYTVKWDCWNLRIGELNDTKPSGG